MRRITLTEVGDRAGVSRSTASLVLRGSSKISKETARRVREAMDELGYVYDRSAANLRHARSMTLGLVMNDLRNPFLADLAVVFERSVRRAGYTVFIGYSGDDLGDQQQMLSAMVEHRIDGCLLMPAAGTERESLKVLGSHEIPSVLFARHLGGAEPYIGPDNVEAGRLLGRHLRTIGVKEAVFLGGPSPSSARAERLAGLREGFDGRVELVDGGLTDSTVSSDSGSKAVSRLLGDGTIPDCIVAYNDIIAVGVTYELRLRGFEPGSDVAVASFDDIWIASQQVPPLTSVSTHAEEVGLACAEELLAQIDEPRQNGQKLIAPSLQVRASTGSWRPRKEDR
ncbi:LacI family DNA-binding transcriptional regulator [Brachybacterium sp.]|uniref:LacI family DNA-binding transcriptional regulator n=1 Tax=Brachybacterium sp. TaxID=1891286 RepID=UPI003F8FF61C